LKVSDESVAMKVAQMNPKCSTFTEDQIAAAQKKAAEEIKQLYKPETLFLVGKDFRSTTPKYILFPFFSIQFVNIQ
jgi:hypothetical protein